MNKLMIRLSVGVSILFLVSLLFFIQSKKNKSINTLIDQENITLDDLQNIKTEIEKEKNEIISNKNEVQNGLVKTGSFNKIDRVHFGEGKAEIIKKDDEYFIYFSKDFKVSSGPDLYVHLSMPQGYKDVSLNGLDINKTISIGKLKNTKGEQVYKITKDQFEKYGDAIIIWCKSFRVQFSRADLK